MAKLRLFNKDDYHKLLDLERQVHDLLPLLTDAEACGFDCREYNELVGDIRQQLTEIKTRFMTPPPTS